MNVGIGTVAAQFLFLKYMFRIFGIVSLRCTNKISKESHKSRWKWDQLSVVQEHKLCITDPLCNIEAGAAPESIAWFIEDQAFPPSYYLASPPPPRPVSRRQVFLCHRPSLLSEEEWGRSQIIRRNYAWSSINHWILSGLHRTDYLLVLYIRFSPKTS